MFMFAWADCYSAALEEFPIDSQPVDLHGANVSCAFAFERRPLIRIFARALVSLQVWCSDINFE